METEERRRVFECQSYSRLGQLTWKINFGLKLLKTGKVTMVTTDSGPTNVITEFSEGLKKEKRGTRRWCTVI